MNNSRDHIGVGCAMGCGIGIFTAIAGMLVALAVGQNTLSNIIIFSVGWLQWIALIPLILHQRKINHPKTVQGIIIAGVIGILLSSACAGLLLVPSMFKS